jgi:hypothetical protein
VHATMPALDKIFKGYLVRDLFQNKYLFHFYFFNIYFLFFNIFNKIFILFKNGT